MHLDCWLNNIVVYPFFFNACTSIIRQLHELCVVWYGVVYCCTHTPKSVSNDSRLVRAHYTLLFVFSPRNNTNFHTSTRTRTHRHGSHHKHEFDMSTFNQTQCKTQYNPNKTCILCQWNSMTVQINVVKINAIFLLDFHAWSETHSKPGKEHKKLEHPPQLL